MTTTERPDPEPADAGSALVRERFGPLTPEHPPNRNTRTQVETRRRILTGHDRPTEDQ